MATELQKKLAINIVKNAKRKRPLNKGQLVEASGYSHTTAIKQLPAVFEQKGVQEELEALGFDLESAKAVVKKILTTGKEENRLKAAIEIFKVVGAYAPDKSISLNLEADVSDRIKELAKKLNAT